MFYNNFEPLLNAHQEGTEGTSTRQIHSHNIHWKLYCQWDDSNQNPDWQGNTAQIQVLCRRLYVVRWETFNDHRILSPAHWPRRELEPYNLERIYILLLVWTRFYSSFRKLGQNCSLPYEMDKQKQGKVRLLSNVPMRSSQARRLIKRISQVFQNEALKVSHL